jgi:hypothetical protein
VTRQRGRLRLRPSREAVIAALNQALDLGHLGNPADGKGHPAEAGCPWTIAPIRDRWSQPWWPNNYRGRPLPSRGPTPRPTTPSMVLRAPSRPGVRGVLSAAIVVQNTRGRRTCHARYRAQSPLHSYRSLSANSRRMPRGSRWPRNEFLDVSPSFTVLASAERAASPSSKRPSDGPARRPELVAEDHQERVYLSLREAGVTRLVVSGSKLFNCETVTEAQA